MVIVAACDDAPVDASDQLGGNRPVGRDLAEPAVGGVGGPQLPLRMGQRGTRRRVGSEGFILFALGELGALDARGADCLQPQLLLVGLLNPSG